MGIIYFRKSGSIGVKVRIAGKDVQLFTPLWLMQKVIDGKAKFGHFNAVGSWKKSKKVKDGGREEEDNPLDE
mgnify:FL=1